MRLLTATDEAALAGSLRGAPGPVDRATVSRARRTKHHPAYQETPGGPFADERCDIVSGPSGPQVRAPEDAIRAFWATRRRGPAPRSTPQEQQ